MNMLNNLFNYDEIEINNINKKYIILIVIIVVTIILLLLMKKDNYYDNTFTIIDGKIVLISNDKEINKIKDNKELFINDIKYDYSIEGLEVLDDNVLVSINLDTVINNINHGTYRIYLGKESMFNYIIKKIK